MFVGEGFKLTFPDVQIDLVTQYLVIQFKIRHDSMLK